MSQVIELRDDERALLWAASSRPIINPDPDTRHLCVNLLARRLLQRAGPMSIFNGWRGSPQAFVLSRHGWNLLKDDRKRGCHAARPGIRQG